MIEHETTRNAKVTSRDVPTRVHLLGAVLGFSAFMVLLWPLDLFGIDGAVRFVLALLLGTAVGVILARYAWWSTR